MQRVFVTGAASGIGAAIARTFADRGSQVTMADRQSSLLASAADKLRPAEIRTCVVDVRNPNQIRRAFDDGGGLFDVVCANAGLSVPEGPLAEMTTSDISRIIDVNVKGTLYTLRAAIPHIRDGGAIVITASTSGLVAHPGAVAYASSKAALVGMGRSLAAELAPRRVRVNMVCPGGVDTPLLDAVYGSARSAADEYAQVNPLGRLATADEVAEAVAFLVDSAHITGVCLKVDGGDSLGAAQ